jgi:outer membrane protein OmpA-like peptidoglycan-associated protein
MLMLNRKLSEDRGNAVLNWLADMVSIARD